MLQGRASAKDGGAVKILIRQVSSCIANYTSKS